jgi:hypothetical protein
MKPRLTFLFLGSSIRPRRRKHTGPDFCRFGGLVRSNNDALDAFVSKNTQSAA